MAQLRIALVVHPTTSSCFAALGLARPLAKRGHAITFVSSNVPGMAKRFERQGFAFVPFGPAFSTEARPARQQPKKKRNLLSTLRQRLVAYKAYGERLMEQIAQTLDELHPDLVLLDSLVTSPAAIPMAILGRGIPVLLFVPNYASPFSLEYPPVFSELVPPEGAGWSAKARHLAAWASTSLLGRPFVGTLQSRIISTAFTHVAQWQSLAEHRRRGGRITLDEWWLRPDLPYIVMGHRGLDWPQLAADPRRCYLSGASAERSEETFDWSKVAAGKPLVYSQTTTMYVKPWILSSARDAGGDFRKAAEEVLPALMRYLRVTVEAFAATPERELILSCGSLAELFQDHGAPNVHVFDRVAQLDVLRRADLVITQGGAATIRECISEGVPMLVFPGEMDQMGNAARVHYHRVGLRGSMEHVTTGELRTLVDRALSDEQIASAVARAHAAHDVEGELTDLYRFIERHTSLSV